MHRGFGLCNVPSQNAPRHLAQNKSLKILIDKLRHYAIIFVDLLARSFILLASLTLSLPAAGRPRREPRGASKGLCPARLCFPPSSKTPLSLVFATDPPNRP